MQTAGVFYLQGRWARNTSKLRAVSPWTLRTTRGRMRVMVTPPVSPFLFPTPFSLPGHNYSRQIPLRKSSLNLGTQTCAAVFQKRYSKNVIFLSPPCLNAWVAGACLLVSYLRPFRQQSVSTTPPPGAFSLFCNRRSPVGGFVHCKFGTPRTKTHFEPPPWP